MTPQHVISQLLDSDTKYPTNLDLLKKILITAYFGRLRINGQPPDNKVSLANYLFDEERVLFDFTRLSESNRTLFFGWLLEPHKKEKTSNYYTSVHVNEDRGFAAEQQLSWWQRLINWFENRYSDHWQITDLNLSINYQLTGIEICPSKLGILVGFNQFLIPKSGTKYKNPDELQSGPLGNTKRVFITNELVNQLIKINLKNINYETMCKSYHPQAIEVRDLEARHKEMHDYRNIQKFIEPQSWYIRLWNWCSSWFVTTPIASKAVVKDNKLTLLYQTETVKIHQTATSKEIVVQEKKPNINNLVYCGGGAKIFAHVGVWKALCEAKIKPLNFAGSSAGGIMALLCYLGYSAEEISDLFQHFKQEHLVFFNIDTNGLSDSNSLKTALDYLIINKIKQIDKENKISYTEGKITFNTFEQLKEYYPDCGVGNELTVTATNKKSRSTQYFSFAKTPMMEVSEAVRISASMPVVYRSTMLNGEEHADGGILNNFPTEVFADDGKTLLESDYGNNLQVLAVQFDNGTERTTLDRMDPVHRENFFLNWFYGTLSGVSDPVSAWEKDRMKLRQYASQSIVVDVDNVSASSFSIDNKSRQLMIQNGYDAAKNYLAQRYSENEDNILENREVMHTKFSSLGDLLGFCCYRGNSHWFDIINNLIAHSSLPNRATLMKQCIELRKLYFTPPVHMMERNASRASVQTFFNNPVLQEPQSKLYSDKHSIFLTIYPIFLKLSQDLTENPGDKFSLELALHSLSINSPLRCLLHFNKIKGKMHIALHIFINLLKEWKEHYDEGMTDMFKALYKILCTSEELIKPQYYAIWKLSLQQSVEALKLFDDKEEFANFLGLLSKKRETTLEQLAPKCSLDAAERNPGCLAK